jgi:RHS repeat-associated protein
LGDVTQAGTVIQNSFWSPGTSIHYTYDRQGNVLAEGDGFATTTRVFDKSYLQNIFYKDENSTTTAVFTNPTYNTSGQILTYDRGALKTQNLYDENNLNRLVNFSLLRFGTSSYPFATSTLSSLAPNNATTTSTVMREKSLAAVGAVSINQTSANYIDFFYPTANVSATRVASTSDAYTNIILSDNFDRANSSLPGGSWVEGGDTNDNLKISSNKLNFKWANQPWGGQHSISQPLPKQNDIKVTYTWRTEVGANVDGYLPYIGIRSNGSNVYNSSYGVALYYIPQYQSIYAYILDNGVVKASATNLVTNPVPGADYNVEIFVNQQNHIEFRIWLASNSRPTNPQLLFNNSGQTYTPNANGDKVIILANHGSNANYSVDVSIDNFKVSTIQTGSVTYSSSDNILSVSTQKDSNIGTSTVLGGYYSFLVKNKKVDMADASAYIQFFKRNSYNHILPTYPDTGQAYKECNLSVPYSDKFMLQDIATGSLYKFTMNTNFWSDYRNSTSTFMNTCIVEGHSISSLTGTTTATTPVVKNEITFANYPTPESPVYYNLVVEASATNTRPTISQFKIDKVGQNLYPRVELVATDVESDTIVEQEIFFRNSLATSSSDNYINLKNFGLVSTTSTTTIYTPASSTFVLDNAPFTFGSAYEVFGRVKDRYGDWSPYASTTYSAPTKTATPTSSTFICKTVTLTAEASVNCPDPDLNFVIQKDETTHSFLGYIPPDLRIMRATVTIATSTDISSSTIGQIYSGDLSNESLFAPIKIDGRFLRLKKNNKYYYRADVLFGWYIYGMPVVAGGTTTTKVYTFQTGDFQTFQNSTYSYDSLSRIKSILKDDDSQLENTLYTYDDLSRLTKVEKSSRTVLDTESFTYSPTGRILQSNSGLHTYTNPHLSHTPTSVGSDSLTWDIRGRLASSSSLGSFLWSDTDRVREKSIGATTSKYYYDTEGNRVLSLTLVASTSSSTPFTLAKKLFTPASHIQNTGSTTSYTISLGIKPIVNIDRNEKVISANTVSTSTVNVISTTTRTLVSTSTAYRVSTTTTYITISTTTYKTVYATTTALVATTTSTTTPLSFFLGTDESIKTSAEWTEFTSTLKTAIHSATSTALSSKTIRPLIGRSGTVNYKQQFVLNNLKTGVTQTFSIYPSRSYSDKGYYVRVVGGEGSITQNSTFTLPGTKLNTYLWHTSKVDILFTPTTPSITLEVGDTNTVNSYFQVDAYSFNLLTLISTTTNILVTTVSSSSLPFTSTTTIPVISTTSTPYLLTSTTTLISTSSTPTIIYSTTTVSTSTFTTSLQTLVTDHLNSIEKVLDFATGNTLSTSTYKSFGKVEKLGDTNSNRGYTNHQMDKDLIYMNNRYQNPNYGIFISSDEATKGLNSSSPLLSNPQSLNSYSYTWNNPVNAFDPDGRLTIIVPGTWYGSDWSTTNTLFVNSMKSFNEIPIVMNEQKMWSGGNVTRDRDFASSYLASMINMHKFKDGEKLNIVAHSHGGNVAKQAISKMNSSIKVDNFVTLGTPVRDDYKTDMSKVNNVVEVYSYFDWTQMNGGDGFGLTSVPGYLANRGRTEFEFGLQNYFEFGPASRYEFSSGEKNKWVNATMDTSFYPSFSRAHGELYSVQSIWDKVDLKLNK